MTELTIAQKDALIAYFDSLQKRDEWVALLRYFVEKLAADDQNLLLTIIVHESLRRLDDIPGGAPRLLLATKLAEVLQDVGLHLELTS